MGRRREEDALLGRIQRFQEHTGAPHGRLAATLGVSRTTLWRLRRGKTLNRYVKDHIRMRLIAFGG